MKALVFSDEPKNAMEIITYLRGRMDIDAISVENKELLDYGANTVYFYSDGFVDNLSKFLASHIENNKYDLVLYPQQTWAGNWLEFYHSSLK